MEVDGHWCKYGLEGEGIVGRGDAKLGCMEATGQKHRQHIDSNGPASMNDLLVTLGYTCGG